MSGVFTAIAQKYASGVSAGCRCRHYIAPSPTLTRKPPLGRRGASSSRNGALSAFVMRVHVVRVRVIAEALDELGQELPVDFGHPCTLTATPPARHHGAFPGHAQGAGRSAAGTASKTAGRGPTAIRPP
jgi:hypothetical protein